MRHGMISVKGLCDRFPGKFMTRFFGHGGRIGRKTMWFGLLAYPLSALWFKRSQDLNKSGLLVVIYLGVAVLSYVVGIIGLSFVAPQVGMMNMPDRTWLFMIIQGTYAIFALYLLVTLGFISGTKGSNLYGVNPSEN